MESENTILKEMTDEFMGVETLDVKNEIIVEPAVTEKELTSKVPELTEEEKKQVEEIAAKIDLDDPNMVFSYGTAAQKKMSEFSEKTLSNVRTKDMDEVGGMISSLVTELKNFDVNENEKGLFAIFKKTANKFEAAKAKYAKVETNVVAISKELEKRQIVLMKDVEVLKNLYDMNLNYFRALTVFIEAGKKKLNEVREVELPALQDAAAKSGLTEDAEKAKDLAAKCDRFEKKIYDLELTRTIALQTAPQIRLVEASDTEMIQKIQSTIINTIPLWKNQMVIALGIQHANEAAKAEREVNDMTNSLLRKNADTLKMATIDAAKESERGIVDIETLKHTNETLISTLDEVMKIQTEGRQKRQAAESELANIEEQLKAKLLEASGKKAEA